MEQYDDWMGRHIRYCVEVASCPVSSLHLPSIVAVQRIKSWEL